MLSVNHSKESLSRAYLTAVVGSARHNLTWGHEYDYGIDATVRELITRGNEIRSSGWGFDIQSKSTSSWQEDGNQIVYDLSTKNHADLVERSNEKRGLPLILIVLCLAKTESWLTVSQTQLVMKRCAYWLQLNASFSSNTSSKRIHIPKTNLFDPGAVTTILQQVQNGDLLP